MDDIYPHREIELASGIWARRRYRVEAVPTKSRPSVTLSRLVPVEGSRLVHYDPWEKYVRARGRDERKRKSAGRSLPPYMKLVQLIESLPPFLDDPAKRRIAAWCTAFGPLGVLLHEVEEVWLPPAKPSDDFRSAFAKRVKELPDGTEPRDWPLPNHLRGREVNETQVGYIRESTGWRVSERLAVGDGRPVVRVRRSGALREEPIEFWERYFPRAVHLPTPLSDAFWDHYEEPLEEFIRAGHKLADVLACFDQRNVSQGRALLHELVRPARAAVIVRRKPTSRRRGEYEQRWVCPSLLSSFGMMILRDLTEEGWTLRRCPCGKYFRSRRANTKYCDHTCYKRYGKKRERAAAKKQKAKGGRRGQARK